MNRQLPEEEAQGAGEMVWQSRVHAALAEGTHLVPSTHTGQLIAECNTGARDPEHLWPPWTPTLTCTPPYTQLKIIMIKTSREEARVASTCSKGVQSP